MRFIKKVIYLISILSIPFSFNNVVSGQMRQVYVDTSQPDNEIHKLSFYSPSEGYVAFRDWVGYTIDSGRTFIKKNITLTNVDFNGYSVNLTFGFGIKGVKAFNKNTIIVYGDYGFVPAILYSTDGGNNFKLIYHSQFTFVPDGGITDMVFLPDNITGYAIDVDRILKTTNMGLSWTVISINEGSYFDYIEAPDNLTIFAFSTTSTKRFLKSTDAGGSWQNVSLSMLPNGSIGYACFLNANTGWLSMRDGNDLYFYKTVNGGTSWVQLNNEATPFFCTKMKFIDDSTGYAIAGLYTVFKTLNSGVTWEPLSRDNNFTYLNYSHNDLQCLSANELWAGGGHGFLELSTNGGGSPLPKAYFKIDTTGVNNTNAVNLVNYSGKGHQYKWYVNNIQVSSNYSVSYTHSVYRNNDSIKLVVISGGYTDTLLQIQYFNVPVLPIITSFSPATGSTGTFVTINGTAFIYVTSVKFGGVEAASFTIVSNTEITATVANGTTGTVSVTDMHTTFELNGFTYYPPSVYAPPSITAVSPLYGPVGTTVTITGSNFNSIITDNLVFFGAVKASLISSSSTKIICTVPVGASFEPVSILNRISNLSGESLKPFNVTFADSSNFTSNSFVNSYTFFYPDPNYAKYVMGKDIDGDGKPDMICIVGGYNDSIGVYRNTTSPGQFSFEPKITTGHFLPYGSGYFDVDDIDGDGKPDVVVPSNDDGDIVIIKNNSIPGSISFADQLNVRTYSGGGQDLVIADLDNDGKKDIAVAGFDNSRLSILRNTSVPGFLSFAEIKHFTAGGNAVKLAVGDINGDGKKDIVVYYFTNGGASGFSLFQNNSSPGNISFASKVDFNVPGHTGQGRIIELADYDNDNKLDVIVMNDSNYCIFRNTSTGANISFAPLMGAHLGIPLDIAQGGHVSNLSGDNRPDIISGNWSFGSASLYQNKSTPGIINTHSEVELNAASYAYYSSSADFDMDGKIDVIMSFANNRMVSIYKNNVGIPITISQCEGGSTSLEADITGSAYQWQQDSGSGFTDLTNANFPGSNTATLSFAKLPLSLNGYKYRCRVDSDYSSQFIIQLNKIMLPTVTITSEDTAICIGTQVTFTATGLNGGTSPFYRWRVNGSEVGTNSATITLNTLNNNDKVSVILFSSDACSNFPSDTSNIITMKVTGVAPSVVISAPDTVICENTPVTFTAVSINAGTPSYQWQVNGVNAGNNNAVFTSSLLTSGSKVKVILTGNSSCSVPVTVNSNIITILVNKLAAAQVSISTTVTKICANSAVTFNASTSNGGTTPSYQWQVDNINAGTNDPVFTTSSLTNGAQVRVIMTGSASCIYPVTATSSAIVITVTNPVVPSVSLSASSTNVCTGTNIDFKATPVNGGLSPIYQWMKNGNNVGTNSSDYSSDQLVNGDLITVSLTNNEACVSTATVISSPVKIATTSVAPGITISGETILTQGSAAAISSTVTDGGTSPTFQWQDSSDTHSWLAISGASGASINYSPAVTGNKVRCILSSSALCATGIITSNTLAFIVNMAINPDENNYGIRCYPNPVNLILILDSLKISDQWETVEITSINGMQKFIFKNIAGQTKVSINTESLLTGMYVAIIRSKDGKSVYLKFLKI